MAEGLGPSSNGNGNGRVYMGPDEALQRLRAIQLLDHAAMAEANGPKTDAKDLEGRATEHIAGSIQPLIDGGQLYFPELVVERHIMDLRGVGPKPFERRRSEEDRLRKRFPDIAIGELAVEASQS